MKNAIARKLLLGCTAFGVLAAVAGCSNSNAPKEEKPVEEEKVQDTEKDDANQDTTAKEDEKTSLEAQKLGDTELRLVQSFKVKGIDGIEAGEGNTYVVAEFELTNNGSETEEISSSMNFTGKADGEKIYPLVVLVPEGYELLDGEVAAGTTKKGVLVYEAPEDFKQIEIEYKTEPTSDEALTFKVSQ